MVMFSRAIETHPLTMRAGPQFLTNRLANHLAEPNIIRLDRGGVRDVRPQGLVNQG